MAVSYLTGDESPTAATMNLLWAEAETLVDKVLDGKSTYLVNPIAIVNPSDPIIRGKEFFFYTSGNHDATDASVLYPIQNPLPASYNQTTYDNAVSGATISYYNASPNYAITSADIGLNDSLKAHTITHSGFEYYVWDKGQPYSEKKWRFAVAEILIGDAPSDGSGGYKFEFSNDYNKYNCFKIHNLTGNDITFYFGTSSSNNHSVSISKYSQRCVRRDSVTSGYDSSYKYFFKCMVNDPRYLYFKSHSGFVPNSMRANNITNASFLYNILENIGERKDSMDDIGNFRNPTRIVFDAHTYTDIGDEYEDAGHSPSITSSTLIGDLIFHKGDISYMRATTSSATPEYGTITFNGFSSIVSAFSPAGLTLDINVSSSTSGNIYALAKITKSTAYDYFYLWQKTTNLLTYDDNPRVINVGDEGANVYLQNGIGEPTISGGANGPAVSNGTTGIEIFDSINASSTTRTDYINKYNTNISGVCTASGQQVKLTTEGPILFSTEDWAIATNLTPTNPAIYFNGFNTNHYYDVYVDTSNDAKIQIKQDRAIAYTLNSSASGRGWPIAYNNITDYHRMFEGPKHGKKYQDRGSAYNHLDITNDPVGADGADFTQNDIGVLTESDIAFQTVKINTKIEPFNINLTDNRSYPLTLAGDVSHELELQKAASANYTNFTNAISGDDTLYIRTNLLKEHYNDLVTMLKKCTKIRPLCFDEVYFGNRQPTTSTVKLLAKPATGYMPKNAYATFASGSAENLLWSRLGVTIGGSGGVSELPDDVFTHATTADKAAIADVRWVTIANVKAKAAAMGFKFRYEKQFQVLSFDREEITYAGITTDVDTFRPDTSGNWKKGIAKAVLSGSSYISGLTESIDHINSNSFWYLTRLVGVSTDANPAVLFYFHDTSRDGHPSTGTRAKLAKMTVDSSGQVGSDSITNLNADEITVNGSGSNQQLYFCQVTPPTTHSA